MDKEKAAERIKKKYIDEYKRVYKKEDRVILFNELIKESKENNLPVYSECFHGYLDLTNKNFGNAIEHFNNSIKLDKSFPYPWHGLGYAYGDLKQPEKAIECYIKATELDEGFAFPLNGLGRIYWTLKEYDKAIECLLTATELDEEYAYPWLGLGLCYFNLKEYEKSEQAYRKSLELLNTQNDQYWISLAQKRIKEIDELMRSQDILEKGRTVKQHDPVIKVLNETKDKGLEKKALENKKTLSGFIAEKRPVKEKDDDSDYFQVLRRWNSYTPIIADNYFISKGGGYFLFVNGTGIVIDPGFNFIDNFKGAGHMFHEIDAVLISHAHNDHTADLESILTLLYKYNKEIMDSSDPGKEDTIRREIAKERKCSIDAVTTEQIEEEFLKSKRRKIVDFYMTKSVFKKFSGLFDLSSKENYKIHMIEEGETKKILKNEKEVVFKVIAAKHRDIISDADSVGFVIEVGDSLLIYTGDTGWNSKIEEKYKNVFSKKDYKSKHKLLIAHLGGFKEKEILYMDDKSDNKDAAFYPNHLGRLGLVKVNEVVKPNICFISEFGEELKGARIEIANIYREAFEDKILFFPADIGLTYNFKSKKIKAITAVNLDKFETTVDYTEPGNIKACCLRKDYSLHYFDQKGDFSEGDLSQVLREHYERSSR